MGRYHQAHLKITLRKDVQPFIINLITASVNNDVETLALFTLPEHDFFKRNDWQRLLGGKFYFNDLFPLITKFHVNQQGCHVLEIHVDLNYGYQSIMDFCNWVLPYCAGRRKKTYLGWMKSDESFDREYLHRIKVADDRYMLSVK